MKAVALAFGPPRVCRLLGLWGLIFLFGAPAFAATSPEAPLDARHTLSVGLGTGAIIDGLVGGTTQRQRLLLGQLGSRSQWRLGPGRGWGQVELSATLGRMRSTSRPFESDPAVVPLVVVQSGLRLAAGIDTAYLRVHLALLGWVHRVGGAAAPSPSGYAPRGRAPLWRQVGPLGEPVGLPGIVLGLGPPRVTLLAIAGDGSFINAYNLELGLAWRDADLPMDATWSARVGYGIVDWLMLSTLDSGGFGTAVVSHRMADMDVQLAAALGGTAWRTDVRVEIPVDFWLR